ncbi:hypothetical protein GCK72_022585 [Caenorhabditis remanei]|uniref:Uncharacterized protein n=1 Tax=Caenorhabditis remanei TaxID=31234 RepID=A0A6A5FU91_CAERE|nr:hypothetical protein GCK72_022585 [Caenorhabditis remanei]KAF1746132.1 hypothetical protein GCK72_022585 [Caenorhabditis remanei]
MLLELRFVTVLAGLKLFTDSSAPKDFDEHGGSSGMGSGMLIPSFEQACDPEDGEEADELEADGMVSRLVDSKFAQSGRFFDIKFWKLMFSAELCGRSKDGNTSLWTPCFFRSSSIRVSTSKAIGSGSFIEGVRGGNGGGHRGIGATIVNGLTSGDCSTGEVTGARDGIGGGMRVLGEIPEQLLSVGLHVEERCLVSSDAGMFTLIGVMVASTAEADGLMGDVAKPVSDLGAAHELIVSDALTTWKMYIGNGVGVKNQFLTYHCLVFHYHFVVPRV